MATSSDSSSPIDDSVTSKPFPPIDADAKSRTSTSVIFEPRDSAPTCRECQRIFEKLSPKDWPPTDILEVPCHGWPAMARVMFEHPGFESFQDFRDLHIKNLLYYQSQLVEIRKQLHRLEWEDHCNGRFAYHEDLSKDMDFLFGTRNYDSQCKENRQLMMIEKMRTVLKEYSEALLLYTKINDLPGPDAFKVKALGNWLRGEEYPIQGSGVDSWGKLLAQRMSPTMLSQLWRLLRTIFWERESDRLDLGLVAPNKKKQADGLTRWAYNEGLPFWENLVTTWNGTADTLPSITGRSSTSRFFFLRRLLRLLRKVSELSREESEVSGEESEPSREESKGLNLASYRISRLLPFARILVTFVGISGGLLPILAIIVLSRVQKHQVLGFIALFTSLFTLGLMFLTLIGKTRISNLDVFTASAAFSAVMVVFVGNHNG